MRTLSFNRLTCICRCFRLYEMQSGRLI